MIMKSKNSDMPKNGWWDYLPIKTHKWIRLARLDRPIGTWLLLFPCLWTLPLSNLDFSKVINLFLLFTIGAFLMRSSGCIINDIWDKNIDKNISRTKDRPLASGEISTFKAFLFLAILLSLALLCLLNLNKQTWIIASASLPLIAIYPLAKRFTRWPQVFLGFVFSWGVPTAWVSTGESINLGIIFIYVGTVFWVIGYDTIYGFQDRSEDKYFGVKNSSISAENYLSYFIKINYLMSILFFVFGGFFLKLHLGWFIGVTITLIHLYFQTTKINKLNRDLSLKIFHSNKIAGLFLVIGSLSKFLYF